MELLGKCLHWSFPIKGLPCCSYSKTMNLMQCKTRKQEENGDALSAARAKADASLHVAVGEKKTNQLAWLWLLIPSTVSK